jgi:ribosomal protein S18 acetylase RimI-like enzyme
MRVHPDYRRNGFAQRILKHLEKVAIQNGLRELRLRTSTQQKIAQDLYEKNGCKKMDTEKEFYTEGGRNTFEVIWYRKFL